MQIETGMYNEMLNSVRRAYHLPQSSLSAFCDAGSFLPWGLAGLAAALGDGSPHLSVSQPDSVASA